jgi:hypothetical protein
MDSRNRRLSNHCWESHGLKVVAKDYLALLGTNGNKLYWLLPLLYFNKFTKNSDQKIDQYAVEISYPSVDE